MSFQGPPGRRGPPGADGTPGRKASLDDGSVNFYLHITPGKLHPTGYLWIGKVANHN